MNSFKVLKSRFGLNSNIFTLMNSEFVECSFWNDIPIYTKDSNHINIGIEIPRLSLAKFEINKQDPNHRIIQDSKISRFTGKSEPRYYAQFPLFNYGFIPQTWENPFKSQYSMEGYFGDDDPLDVLEVGSKSLETGDILEVRVLGCFCLIDQGEIDWKFIVLNRQEAEEKNITSTCDLSQVYISAIHYWFEGIKVFDGKPKNHIPHKSFHRSPKETLEIIEEYHKEWKLLVTGDGSREIEEKRKEFGFSKD